MDISRILNTSDTEKTPTRSLATTTVVAEKRSSDTGSGTIFGSTYEGKRQPERPLPQLEKTIPSKGQQVPQQLPKKQKQSKWTTEEDALIISLRGQRMTWEHISSELPGRSVISCRLRYQNYLERRMKWDEDKKNKLARLYERFKREMWQKVAEEMGIPWRTVEAMHWKLGEREIAQRAGVKPFTLANNPSSSPRGAPTQEHSSGVPDFAASIPAYTLYRQSQHQSHPMQLHQNPNVCSPMLKPPPGSSVMSTSYEGTRRSMRRRKRM